jgi:hypothetical protein
VLQRPLSVVFLRTGSLSQQDVVDADLHVGGEVVKMVANDL